MGEVSGKLGPAMGRHEAARSGGAQAEPRDALSGEHLQEPNNAYSNKHLGTGTPWTLHNWARGYRGPIRLAAGPPAATGRPRTAGHAPWPPR